MLTDMKKTILLPALLLLIFEGAVFAQTLTFTNTFGGNVDNLRSSDFIRYLKDENDEFQKKSFQLESARNWTSLPLNLTAASDSIWQVWTQKKMKMRIFP